MNEDQPGEQASVPLRRISLFGRDVHLPQSRAARLCIGILLVLFGLLGFLPVLGFWMIPLGMLVLAQDFASVRRFNRRAGVRFWRSWASWRGRGRKRNGTGRPPTR